MTGSHPPQGSRCGSTTSLARYSLAGIITVVAILSQYFLPQTFPAAGPIYASLPGDAAVTYGIPILAFSLLVGADPLRGWARRMGSATWQGFRWYGLLLTLALFVTGGLAAVYAVLDPSALQLLSRPNPALEQAAGNPWLFVGLSFAVGALEETIFRGWIFGYWLRRGGGWIGAALWSSALFASVHLYYGTTYGIAAPLIFPTLFLTGLSFAVAFKATGGNLVVIALLHGGTDAASYLSLVSPGVSLALHFCLIGVGLLIALADLLRRDAPGGSLPARFSVDPALPWEPRLAAADSPVPGSGHASRPRHRVVPAFPP